MGVANKCTETVAVYGGGRGFALTVGSLENSGTLSQARQCVAMVTVECPAMAERVMGRPLPPLLVVSPRVGLQTQECY